MEPVLLNVAKMWTNSKSLNKQMVVTQGCTRRHLMCTGEVTHQMLNYIVSHQRMMSLAGHCIKNNDKVASKFVLWQRDDCDNDSYL